MTSAISTRLWLINGKGSKWRRPPCPAFQCSVVFLSYVRLHTSYNDLIFVLFFPRRPRFYSTRLIIYTNWNKRKRDFYRKTVNWSGWWASKRASCWARPACTRNVKLTTPPVSERGWRICIVVQFRQGNSRWFWG